MSPAEKPYILFMGFLLLFAVGISDWSTDQWFGRSITVILGMIVSLYVLTAVLWFIVEVTK